MTCILLVDDDPDSILPLALELVHRGHIVTMASSAASALSVIRQMVIQCVITDCEMPGIDGVEFCRILRAHPLLAELPVALMSAAPEPNEPHRYWSRFLRKPVALAELLTVVDQVSAPRLTQRGESSGRGNCIAPRFEALAAQRWHPLKWTF